MCVSMKFILEKLGEKGISFIPTTETYLTEIEKAYGFVFPYSLREFYKNGFPYSDKKPEFFPNWWDLSIENIEKIKKQMNLPFNILRKEIENGFWIDKWGDRPLDKTELSNKIDEIFSISPLLIPIFSHRYMPAISAENVPVISSVGRDTIYYGANICEYLQNEFLKDFGEMSHAEITTKIPLWSDIINHGYTR